jgi:2-hydroxychromene-2-carboxylate isomerase
MTKRVDYYLSLNSPWSFLGHDRIVDIAARANAALVPIPVDFSIVFPVTGGLPVPKRAPARQAYRLAELKRWRSYLEIPLNLSPTHWPAPDVLCTGMVIALSDRNTDALRLAGAFMRAVWVEDRDIGDETTMVEIATEQGLDGKALLELSRTGSPEETRIASSKAAIERGVFGAPSYVIDDEVFWGQDRIEFVARALGVDA